MPPRQHGDASSLCETPLRAPRLRVGRLRRRSEFLAVAGNRRKFVTPGMIVQIRRQTTPTENSKTTNGKAANAKAENSKTAKHSKTVRKAERAVLILEPIRLGYTASRKVGNAVARNRARRRLRVLAREILVPHAVLGYDFVLIARPETVLRPWSDLQTDLQTALRRLGVWQGADDDRRTRKENAKSS
ncbi:ribonuclease P protein component [Azospirillaceae bacterium]